MKLIVVIMISVLLGWSGALAADDDLDVTMEMVMDEEGEAVSDAIVRDLQLPERAADRARERAEPGLETAREASEQGREKATEARERGREARERRGERVELPDASRGAGADRDRGARGVRGAPER